MLPRQVLNPPNLVNNATGAADESEATVGNTHLPAAAPFREEHPLHSSHRAHRYPTPCIPRFLGVLPQRPQPDQLDSPSAQTYYAFVLGNFRAHRQHALPPGTTLRSAYEHFMNVELQQMDKQYRDILRLILNNVQDDHDSKERRRQHQAQLREERRNKGLVPDALDEPNDGGEQQPDEQDGELRDARLEAHEDGAAQDEYDPDADVQGPAASLAEVAGFDLDGLEPTRLWDRSTRQGDYLYGAIEPALDRPDLPNGFGMDNRGWIKSATPEVQAVLDRALAAQKKAGKDGLEETAAPAPGSATAADGTRVRIDQRDGCVVVLVDKPNGHGGFSTSTLPAGTRPPMVKMDKPPSHSDVIHIFNLAPEQALAFLIFAEYFDAQQKWLKDQEAEPHPGPPPRVLLVGKPGTGKSQVVHALQWYVFQHEEPNWFATCAYAWTAALAFSHHAHRSLSTHSMFQLTATHNSGHKNAESNTRIKPSAAAKLQVRRGSLIAACMLLLGTVRTFRTCT